MTTSKNGIGLRNPTATDLVPLGTFGYFQARNKRNAYDLVMDEFAKSELSQAGLARRLGKGTDVVCRLLGGPGNWTLNTLSDLLFAISGATPVFGVEYPLNKAARNQKGPIWLYEESDPPVAGTDRTVDYPRMLDPTVEPVFNDQ
jgi:hypothetical protein